MQTIPSYFFLWAFLSHPTRLSCVARLCSLFWSKCSILGIQFFLASRLFFFYIQQSKKVNNNLSEGLCYLSVWHLLRWVPFMQISKSPVGLSNNRISSVTSPCYMLEPFRMHCTVLTFCRQFSSAIVLHINQAVYCC